MPRTLANRAQRGQAVLEELDQHAGVMRETVQFHGDKFIKRKGAKARRRQAFSGTEPCPFLLCGLASWRLCVDQPFLRLAVGDAVNPIAEFIFFHGSPFNNAKAQSGFNSSESLRLCVLATLR